MDEEEPQDPLRAELKRLSARIAVLDLFLVDAIAARFPTEERLDAWAQQAAATGDAVVEGRELTAFTLAYQHELADLLARVRKHWRAKHSHPE